ncbi:MAG: hypothetical protein H0U73_08545 [Tatlockia sp.]|nr:hypothetical protein [Tatlockia sp.]
MKTLKLACISTLLAAGIAHASIPCNGLEIKIKNNTTEDLIATGIKLVGAELNPGSSPQINAKTEQVFSVNNSNKDVEMTGELIFHTASLPSKEVKIQFNLRNKTLSCHHEDITPLNANFSIDKNRYAGKVDYTISHK